MEEGEYNVGRLYNGNLPEGRYIYIGSAWGPGGLGARVSRHLSKTKKIHWHIDWITSDPRCRLIAIYLLPGGKSESSLYRALSSTGKCIIPGFGSSDDPRSECHFLRLKAVLHELDSVLSGFYPNYIKILL